MNILFTCAGRRNYLIHYFKEIIGDGGKIIAVDGDATAPALADADIALTVPSVFDKNYVDSLLAIVLENRIDLIIPLNDLELPIMAASKEKFEANGAQVVISHPDVIDLCADKWKTYNFFRDLKIPTPRSFIKIEDVLEALAEKSVQFPMVLKPRWGFGSVGIQEVETQEELHLAYQLLLAKVNKTLMSSIASDTLQNPVLFQEKIIGEEFGIDIVNDFNGNYYGSYARKKLAMRAGETDKAKSVIDRQFCDLAEKIGKATQHMGVMDCDFFIKDGRIYFLEMNPRFGGGYPFSHEAGVNVPAMYLAWLQGNSKISENDNYRSGVVFSKCDRIIRISDAESTVEKEFDFYSSIL